MNARLLRHRARHRVLAVVRIAEDLEALAVEGAEERQQEEGDRVTAEVGRDIADAKPRVRVPRPRVRHALHIGKEAIEALGQPCKRRTLLHGNIVEREERVAVFRHSLRFIRFHAARGEKGTDACCSASRERQRRTPEAIAFREELSIVGGKRRGRLLGKPLLQIRDERREMLKLRARPAFGLLDVDLLQRRARVRGSALADACDLRTRRPIVAKLHERRRQHIAKLHEIVKSRRLAGRSPRPRGKRRLRQRTHIRVPRGGKKAARLAEQLGRRAACKRRERLLRRAALPPLLTLAALSHALPPRSRRAPCSTSPACRAARRTPPRIFQTERYASRAPQHRLHGCASRSSRRAIRQDAC